MFVKTRADLVDNRASNDYDGQRLTFRVGMERGIGGHATIGISVFSSDSNLNGYFASFRRQGLKAFTSADVGRGFQIKGSLGVLTKIYDRDNPIYVESRDALRTTAHIRMSKADLFLAKRFTPYIAVAAERYSSKIDALSYSTQQLRLGLEAKF